MHFLTSRADFEAFAATLHRDFAYPDSATAVAEPTEYPCYAYADMVHLDYGMEEAVQEPRYLYVADTEMMHHRLRSLRPHAWVMIAAHAAPPIVRYDFLSFSLTFEAATGRAITRYANGRWSGCAPVPEDTYHAERLGITPAAHRLAHELAHHLVGIALGYSSSPVIHRDAHHIPQNMDIARPLMAAAFPPLRDRPITNERREPLTAHIEEWMTTAITYHAFGRMDRADYVGNYPGALAQLREAERINVDAAGLLLHSLVEIAESVGPGYGGHVSLSHLSPSSLAGS